MGLRRVLQSRWIKILLLLILLLLLAGASYLFYELKTNTPAMYNTVGLEPTVTAGPPDESFT